MIKVEQFYNKNQFLIKDDNKIVFQSYNSTIAILENGKLTLGYNWDYSTTISKHLYLFIEDYCTFIKDNNANSIGYQIRQESNKRKYINKLIQTGRVELLDLDK